MLAFAPSPEDIAGFLGLYLVLPIVFLIGAFRLRRQPRWFVGWLLSFAAFYGYLFIQANPATSRKRADVTLVIQDLQGHPVANASFEVTQYPVGDGHPAFPRVLDQTVTTDAAGRAIIITTPDRRISATFRVPGFRWASLSLDRVWTPTFHTVQGGYSWAVLPKNEKVYRSNSTGIVRNFRREQPLTIQLILPSPDDEDSAIEARMRELLPNDA